MDEIKNEIAGYWSGREEKFAALRLDELKSEKRERWLSELRRYLPPGRKLDVLDVGTGTGFFCFLLAAEGHRATGVDLSEKMIRGAERAAALLGLTAAFRVMDAEKTDFAERSFDAVVTRNLTCFLPDLPGAYRHWFGLLRGGVLINFDGNYNYDEVPSELPRNHAHADLSDEQRQAYERIRASMRCRQKGRPAWDERLLAEAGFDDIRVDRGVGARVYREFDKFYNPVPVFAVAARKRP